MNRKHSKPRIALFGMGVIGGIPKGHGVPVLEDLFTRVSSDFEFVFYSFNNINHSAVSPLIPVRQVVRWKLPGRLKFFLITLRFVIDHMRNPYQCIFAVSVYPTGWWAVQVAKLLRIKVLVQVITLELVSLPDIGYGNLSKPWLRKKTFEVCRNASHMIAVADYQMKIALENVPVPMRITSLPLRIDPDKFFYKKRTVSFPVRFIHVAYYSPVKDQDTMFRAFAKVAAKVPAHLTVVGEGYDIPSVKEMLTQLSIYHKVTFKGMLTQGQIARLLDESHIMLHPARYETGCAVIQEAMASGVAVCGSDVGLLSDIGERYAVIVPAQSPNHMADEILSLINDGEKFERITTEAYQWIRKYDAAWSAGNYRDFLSGILQKND